MAQTFLSVKTFEDKWIKPGSVFNRVITDHGFCYSFNMLGYHSILDNETLSKDFDSYRRKGIESGLKILDDEHEHMDWNIEDGYLTDDPNAFPRRVIKGATDKIKFTLFINRSDVINMCPRMEQSYKVILHQPHEIPTIFHNYQHLGLELRHIIAVKVWVDTTDESLAAYPTKTRKCFYRNERKLLYFKGYTKEQCISECFANYTLKTCGCMRFSMPRGQHIPVCGLDRAKCLTDVVQTWAESKEFNRKNSVLCNCLPECHRINYDLSWINDADTIEDK